MQNKDSALLNIAVYEPRAKPAMVQDLMEQLITRLEQSLTQNGVAHSVQPFGFVYRKTLGDFVKPLPRELTKPPIRAVFVFHADSAREKWR